MRAAHAAAQAGRRNVVAGITKAGGAPHRPTTTTTTAIFARPNKDAARARLLSTYIKAPRRVPAAALITMAYPGAVNALAATRVRATSSTTATAIWPDPALPNNLLSVPLSHPWTLLQREFVSSSPRQLLWDSVVAGILAIASASWLLVETSNNPRRAQCESSAPAAPHIDHPHHPAAANVVSFRPRWFNNLLNGGGTASSSNSSRGGDAGGEGNGQPVPVASVMSSDPQGVLLQSTGKPYDVSVRAIRGGRFTMEDEYFVANGGRFAAVFDGHGGSGVAQLLKKKLYSYVTHFLLVKHWEESEYDDNLDEPLVLVVPRDHQPDSSTADATSEPSSTTATAPPSQPAPVAARRRRSSARSSNRPTLTAHVSALRAAFEKIEQDVMDDDNLEFQGSTAVAVVLYESEDGHRTLLSANVGDSRAVLSRNGWAVDLTHDHKPNDEREKARIMAMGETIEWDQDCKVHRVRNLSLARAIGDRYAKPAVSPEVEIQHFPVNEGEDEFIVIASDGLWDVMSSQDAVSFVHDQMRKELSANSMSKEAADNYRLVLRRNMAKFLAREAIRKGSSDNVSVLMVWL